MGYTNNGDESWEAKKLTKDHSPEDAKEKARILKSGGKVACMNGVSWVINAVQSMRNNEK